MIDSQDLARVITADLDELKEYGRQYLLDELREGGWFLPFMKASLVEYAQELDLAYFLTTYPEQDRLTVAASRIEVAKRCAALEGTLASDTYNPTVQALLGGGAGTDDVVTPETVQPFVADLLYTTRLQLRLAHDLCVLNERFLDLDDTNDQFDLLRIAFGSRVGDLLIGAVKAEVPEVTTKGFEANAGKVAAAIAKSLPLVGKHLLKRNIVKFAIPVVSVRLNAALGFYFTGDIPHTAGKVLAEKATDPEVLKDLARLFASSPRMLLEVIWLVVVADEEVSAGESKFMNDLTMKLTDLEGGEDTIALLKGLSDIDAEEVLARVAAESEEVKQTLYQVVCDAAAIDHKIQRKERKIVERFAKVCGRPFDEKDLKRRSKWK